MVTIVGNRWKSAWWWSILSSPISTFESTWRWWNLSLFSHQSLVSYMKLVHPISALFFTDKIGNFDFECSSVCKNSLYWKCWEFSLMGHKWEANAMALDFLTLVGQKFLVHMLIRYLTTWRQGNCHGGGRAEYCQPTVGNWCSVSLRMMFRWSWACV